MARVNSFNMMCVLMWLGPRYSSALKEINMAEYCGKEYTVTRESLLVHYLVYLTSSCQFALETGNDDERLFVRAIKVDFEKYSCKNDSLALQDGYYKGQIMERLCESAIPKHTHATTGRWLTLNATFLSTQYPPYPFQLLVSKYSHKDCDHGRFICKNRKCIAGSLKCDGWNNCGDDSDETFYCGNYPTQIINKRCGQEKYLLTAAAVFVRLEPEAKLLSCKFEILTDGDPLIVKAIVINLLSDVCEYYNVTLRNETGMVLVTFCFDKTPLTAYFTTSRYLSIDYSSYSVQDAFLIMITRYTNGPCDKNNQFKCDSGRCIMKTLHCDGWDNCGDNSDEIRDCPHPGRGNYHDYQTVYA